MKNQKRLAIALFALVVMLFSTLALTSCGGCDHDYGEWTVRKEATCFSEGEMMRVCKHDASHVEVKPIEKVEHNYGNYVSDGKATCHANGHMTASCMNVGCTATNVILEAKKDHSFTSYVTVDATCTEGAYRTAVCDTEGCDATDVQLLEDKPALDHSYDSNSICTICGEALAALAQYAISESGSGSVVAYIYETEELFKNNTPKLLLRLDGAGSVKDFQTESNPDAAPWAEYAERIAYLEVANSVTYLGEYTFANLEKLESVKLSVRITEIPKACFYGCEAITEITVPAKVTVIGDSAFYNCKRLVTVNFDDGCELQVIAADAFNSCRKIENIVLPETVEFIYENAFYSCAALKTINVSDSIVEIASNAFAETALTVSVDNNADGVYDAESGDVQGVLTNYKGGTYLAIGENLHAILLTVNNATLEKINAEDTTGSALVIHKDAVLVSEDLLKSSTSVKAITVEDGNARYTAIDNCLIVGDTIIAGVSSSTIPTDASVTTIGANAFSGCDFAEIVIPANITTIEDNAFYQCKSLKSITLSEGLESIGSNAFASCTALEQITIPASVSDFGVAAFAGCTALKTVVISEGVEAIGDSAFSACTAITAITLPESLVVIGDSAFAECAALTEITIPANVQTVGSKAFIGCTALKTATLNAGVEVVGSQAFALCTALETVIFGDGLVEVLDNAFYGCSAIKSIAFPEETTYIGAYAFANCSKLESISLPESLEVIGDYAFTHCTAITTLEIPDNILLVGEGAFFACSGIESIDMPSNAGTIESAAFAHCTALTYVQVPGGIGYIGMGAFYGCTSLEMISVGFTGSDVNATDSSNFAWLFTFETTVTETDPENPESTITVTKDVVDIPAKLTAVVISGGTTVKAGAFENCSTIKSIYIPKTVTKIENAAFNGCTSLSKVEISDLAAWCAIVFDDYYSNPLSYAKALYLKGDLITELVIPDGITEIAFAAFTGCEFTSITFPDSLVKISGAAFKDCSFIAELIIPDSVTEIGILAFANCSSLLNITLPEGLTAIEPYAFSGCANLTSINIPASVTSIDNTAFVACDRLETVTVSETNAVFTSFDGIVYSKSDVSIKFIPHAIRGDIEILDGVTVIAAGLFEKYPYIDSLTVPNSVTFIGKDAFIGCTTLKSVTLPFIGDGNENVNFTYVFGTLPVTLTSVTITGGDKVSENAFKDCIYIVNVALPEGMTAIEKSAFANCSALTTLLLPKSATSIANDAFAECKKLHTIYYLGTEADYSAITVGTNNIYFKGAKVYYYNENVTEEGAATNWYYDEDGRIVIW